MAYSLELKEKVLMKIENGEKIKDISDDIGISKSTLYKWVKEMEDKNITVQKQKVFMKKRIICI